MKKLHLQKSLSIQSSGPAQLTMGNLPGFAFDVLYLSPTQDLAGTRVVGLCVGGNILVR